MTVPIHLVQFRMPISWPREPELGVRQRPGSCAKRLDSRRLNELDSVTSESAIEEPTSERYDGNDCWWDVEHHQ